MPIERFNYVKPQVGNGDNIRLVSQAWGTHANRHQLINAPSVDQNNIEHAGLYSTAPYVPVAKKKPEPKWVRVVSPSVSLAKIEAIDMSEPEDGERPAERTNHCLGNNDTCAAWATKRWPGYCPAHGRINEGLTSYGQPKGG